MRTVKTAAQRQRVRTEALKIHFQPGRDMDWRGLRGCHGFLALSVHGVYIRNTVERVCTTAFFQRRTR